MNLLLFVAMIKKVMIQRSDAAKATLIVEIIQQFRIYGSTTIICVSPTAGALAGILCRNFSMFRFFINLKIDANVPQFLPLYLDLQHQTEIVIQFILGEIIFGDILDRRLFYIHI